MLKELTSSVKGRAKGVKARMDMMAKHNEKLSCGAHRTHVIATLDETDVERIRCEEYEKLNDSYVQAKKEYDSLVDTGYNMGERMDEERWAKEVSKYGLNLAKKIKRDRQKLAIHTRKKEEER